MKIANEPYDTLYYENKNGEKVIKEYIDSLLCKQDKDSRIKANKIVEFIYRLQQFGTRVGMPTVRKIENSELWELRPLADRIFFAYWKDNIFILLHQFVKKSQKTPKKEIEQAERNLKDWLERFGD